MIVDTAGSVKLRIADCEPTFVCGDGVSVTYHRTALNPCEDAPLGVENVTVTSPAGWLHYAEVDGFHTFSMGEAPVTDGQLTPQILDMFGGGV